MWSWNPSFRILYSARIPISVLIHIEHLVKAPWAESGIASMSGRSAMRENEFISFTPPQKKADAPQMGPHPVKGLWSHS